MPIIDNRPNEGVSGGGGSPAISVNEVKLDWKIDEISMAGIDIANTYVTLITEPQDTKVLVKLLGLGDLNVDQDFTIDKPNRRIYFQPATLAKITESFNLHGTQTIKAAYYAVTTIV